MRKGVPSAVPVPSKIRVKEPPQGVKPAWRRLRVSARGEGPGRATERFPHSPGGLKSGGRTLPQGRREAGTGWHVQGAPVAPGLRNVNQLGNEKQCRAETRPTARDACSKTRASLNLELSVCWFWLLVSFSFFFF